MLITESVWKIFRLIAPAAKTFSSDYTQYVIEDLHHFSNGLSRDYPTKEAALQALTTLEGVYREIDYKYTVMEVFRVVKT